MLRRSLQSLGGEPAYRPVSGWQPWQAMLAVVLMFFAAAGAAVMVSAVLDVLRGPGASSPVPAGGGRDHVAVLVWLLTLQVVLTGLVVMASRRRGGAVQRELALAPPAQGIMAYLGGMALLIMIFGAYTALVLLFRPEAAIEDVRPFADLIRSDVWWLALLVVGIGAPVSEELVFRGFLFSALAASRLGVLGAALITTTAWTSLHAGYSVYGLVEVFAVGLLFSWLLWKTGSLRVPLLCHAAYNSSIILALRLVDLPA